MSRKSQACPCHALPCRKTRPRDDYFIGFIKNILLKVKKWHWLTLPLVKRNKNEDVTSPFKRASSIINCLCNIFQRFIRGSKELSWKKHNCHLDTGKSLSEALLFAEHGENMLCTKIVLNVRNNFCTQHVLPKFKLEIFYVLNL